MKKLKIVGLIMIGIIFFITLFLYSVVWYRFTDFYQQCGKIKIGINRNEVIGIMNDFISNNDYLTSYDGWYWVDGKITDSPGIFISKHSSGNYCNIILDRNLKVKDIVIFFE